MLGFRSILIFAIVIALLGTCDCRKKKKPCGRPNRLRKCPKPPPCICNNDTTTDSPVRLTTVSLLTSSLPVDQTGSVIIPDAGQFSRDRAFNDREERGSGDRPGMCSTRECHHQNRTHDNHENNQPSNGVYGSGHGPNQFASDSPNSGNIQEQGSVDNSHLIDTGSGHGHNDNHTEYGSRNEQDYRVSRTHENHQDNEHGSGHGLENNERCAHEHYHGHGSGDGLENRERRTNEHHHHDHAEQGSGPESGGERYSHDHHHEHNHHNHRRCKPPPPCTCTSDDQQQSSPQPT